MPEELKAEVKNRRKISLQEDEMDKFSPTSGVEEDIPQSRAAQEDKSRVLQVEKEKIAMVREDEIVIEADIKSMVEEDIKSLVEEDIKSMVEEDIKSMVDEDIKSMVEEDSSRRGSLLDELREEEEMRLRLLQVVR